MKNALHCITWHFNQSNNEQQCKIVLSELLTNSNNTNNKFPTKPKDGAIENSGVPHSHTHTFPSPVAIIRASSTTVCALAHKSNLLCNADLWLAHNWTC